MKRNDSENKGFGLKGTLPKNDNMGTNTGNNFRNSSKDAKGQQSTKNLGSNFNTLSKKKEEGGL